MTTPVRLSRTGVTQHIAGPLQMRLLISLSLILALGCLNAEELKAATIERYSDPVMGCSILLSGQIVAGDTERLQDLVEAVRNESPRGDVGRVCLNSPGGSFEEGVRLAQFIRRSHYLGTAIGDGHICESACAVSFMAGGWTEGGYDSVRPIMHPRSRLGFHAPSIEIPAGQYNEAQVSRAWNVALGAVAQILEMRSGPLNVSDNYNFSDRLFLEMISTPSDAMFYIDTVERAAIFEIAVFPVGINSASPAQAFTNLCMAASGVPISGVNFVPQIRREATDEIQAYFQSGFGDEASSSCRVTLRRQAVMDRDAFRHSRDRPVSIEWNGSESGGEPYATQSGAFQHMTFDGSTRLEALPTDTERSWEEFAARIQPVGPTAEQCWLTSA
ncbi:MAG: hypothetical protein RIB61_06895, partial [Roseicyclus sp.]